jgi:hypothetical protein
MSIKCAICAVSNAETAGKKKLKCQEAEQVKSSTNQTNQTINQSTMSATIMMPSSLENSIKTMLDDAVAQAVATLAEKYNFDGDDAMRELNLGDIKIGRKRGPAPKADKATKSKGKSKDDADKPKTKRGPTGYLLFSKEERPAAKETLMADLEEDTKLKPQDVVREIASRWKALSETEKAVWNSQAADIKSEASSVAASEDDTSVVASDDDEAKPKAETKTDPKAKAKAKPKVEPKEDAEPKKKGTTGYLMFAKNERPTIKAEMTEALDEGVKLKPQDVVTEIANRWKALTDDERKVWNDQAKTPVVSEDEE